MKTLRELAFLLVASALSMLRVAAQTELDPVTVPVPVTGEYWTEGDLSEWDPAQFWMNLPGLYLDSGAIDYGPTQGSVTGTLNLKPGKSYSFYVGGVRITDYALHFQPPTGYSLFIENVERRRFASSGDRWIKVRISADAVLPAGVAPEPRPGRVLWSVGMGQLKNGESAESIQLRENGLTATTFTPAALYYDHENPDVRVVAPGGVLRQAFANECLADVLPDGDHAFWIRFYARTQVFSQNGDGTWQVGTPFKEYKIENPVHPTIDRLKITQINHVGSDLTSWTQIQNSGGTWTVLPWNYGIYPDTPPALTTVAYSNGDKYETVTVKSSSNVVAAQSFQEYKDYAWGRELCRTIAGYGATPLETLLEYHDSGSGAGNYRQLKWRIAPDGNWERFEYYDDFERQGLIHRVYRPFGDAVTHPASATTGNCEVVEFDYGLDFFGKKTLPTAITTTRNGIASGSTVIAYDSTSETRNSMPIVVATRNDYAAAGQSLQTVSRLYRADVAEQNPSDPLAAFYANKLHSIVRPDGTMQAHLYLWGVYNFSNRVFSAVSGGTEFMHMVIEGTTASGEDLQIGGSNQHVNHVALSSYLGYEIGSSFHIVDGKSTAVATIFDSAGNPIGNERSIYASSGWQVIGHELGAFQQGLAAYPLWRSSDSGNPYAGTWDTFNAAYTGGLMTWSADATGAALFVQYDLLGRPYWTIRPAVSGQPGGGESWTFTEHDAASRPTRTWKTNDWHWPNPTSEDLVSSTTYDWAGRVTSATVPGVVGDSVTTYTTYTNYSWGGNPRLTRVLKNDGAEAFSETCLDGRPKSVTGSAVAPKYVTYHVESDGQLRTHAGLTNTEFGDGWSETRTDWLGRVVRQESPTAGGGRAVVTPEYNSKGQLVARFSRDENNNLLVAPSRYEYNSLGQLEREGTDIDESGALVESSLDRLTRHVRDFHLESGAWWARTQTWAYTQGNSATAYLQNETMTRLTGLTPSLRNETRSKDANTQTATATTIVDRGAVAVTATTQTPGASTPAVAVAINGLKSSETSSTGVTTTYTYDAYGRPLTANGRESVMEEKAYYPGTTYLKNVRNAIMRPQYIGQEWQEFYYDSAGRLAKQRTNNLGTWKTARYDYTATGQLAHQWGDAINPAEFTYNAYGWKTNMSLFRGSFSNASETWPGGYDGVDTTTWNYQGSTGLVTSKVAPGGATTSFTYNRRNQVATRLWARVVPDGQPNAGQRVTTTYAYAETAGYRTGELEDVSYNDGTAPVAYRYDDWGGAYSRTGRALRICDATGWHTFGYRAHDQQLEIEYLWNYFYGLRNNDTDGRLLSRTYDTLGRPSAVRFGWNSNATENQQIVYGYDGATGRVDTITSYNPAVADRAFGYTYRANSNLVSNVDSGSFHRSIAHQSWRTLIDTVTVSWDSATRAQFNYDYDWIEQRNGQRIEGTLASALGYGPGVQNLYGYTPRGEVDWTNAHRTDNSADIPDRYRDWTYDNQGNRDFEQNNSGNRDFEPVARNEYASIGGIGRAYDADGNLTNDGTWWYYFDGENRLTCAQKQDWSKRLEFTYDYMGRRARKVVKNGDINTAVASDRRYVYDSWNIIAELDGLQAALPALRTFTWGLDITGTVHGGGGVGGLLMICDTIGGNFHWLPVTDANGNIHGLLNGGDGALVAAYAYSATGELLAEVNPYGGTWAQNNAIRFASKWYDAETGLYDYNHRVYSPSEGRFISRDPIAENGGLNLYAYCGNDPVGHYDYLGMVDPVFIPPPDANGGSWVDMGGGLLVYNGPGSSGSGRVGITVGGNQNVVQERHNFLWASDGDGSSSFMGRVANADAGTISVLGRDDEGNYIVQASNAAAQAKLEKSLRDYRRRTGQSGLVGFIVAADRSDGTTAGLNQSGPWSHAIDKSKPRDILLVEDLSMSHDASGYTVTRAWRVPNPSQSGFIIQKVERPNKTYWEVWRVELSEDGNTVRYPSGHEDFITFAEVMSMKTQRYTETVSVEATWMPGYVLSQPIDRWAPGGLYDSGDLLMTTSIPNGWPNIPGTSIIGSGYLKLRALDPTTTSSLRTVEVGFTGAGMAYDRLPPLGP